MTGRWMRLGLLTVAVAIVMSCGSKRRTLRNVVLVDTGPPALHAVHSEELDQLMLDLNQLLVTRLPTELDVNRERAQQAEKFAEVAQALADSASYIPNVLEGTDLTVEQCELFVSMAEKLQHESLQLKALAEQRRMDEIPGQIDEMVATCNACHTAFRVLPAASSSP